MLKKTELDPLALVPLVEIRVPPFNDVLSFSAHGLFSLAAPRKYQMKARQTTIADRPQIEAIVKSNPKMYGADITRYHSITIHRFVGHVVGDLAKTAWCVEDDEGQIVGLAIQFWWTSMPAWSIASLFFKNEPGKNQFNAHKIGAVLVNAMCKEAESRKMYDFYYVVRDNESLRKNMSLSVNDEFTERYEINDLFLLHPYTSPIYPMFKNMLGHVIGRNRKPVVFRLASLKSKYRPSVWV